ncbi:MAG: DUF1893 domain-containing protein [Spirochaetales bacterium]|jgi:hypothetical protein|nr:DUF1893 domain-containing protein [Spirochaetales bacterium]
MENNTDTLQMRYQGRTVFTSKGRWLHPLFELERFLANHSYISADIEIKDKIIGKAAAVLICRLGIKVLRVGILSRPGKEILEANDVVFSYDLLIDRIDCITEELLADKDDFDEIHEMLLSRAAS